MGVAGDVGGAGNQQGEQQTFTGRVTSVREGFCFLESRPGERCRALRSGSVRESLGQSFAVDLLAKMRHRISGQYHRVKVVLSLSCPVSASDDSLALLSLYIELS